ncbi:MAG: hemolysin III family protein [Clostridiales bacterium]|nr:hemolysin III family protein [Clostridiales bacterium]
MKLTIREPINSITHFIGAILSIIGLILLLKVSVESRDAIKILSSIIFSMGLISLYLTSSIYHGVYKNLLLYRKLDHIMIYFLIAASYTPICLITLKGKIGYIFISVIWSLAITGSIMKIFWLNAPRWLYTSFYLGLGWAALFVLFPLYKALPHTAIFLLIIGGLSYSIGAVIYGTKSKKIKIWKFGFHEIFHIFILFGSLSHFIMIYKYIIS